MRLLGVLAVALAACSDPGGIPNRPDASQRPVDATSIDGDGLCHTTVTLKSTMEGHVGGLGGGKGPALACNDTFGERIVGVALYMSDGNTSFGARSADGIRIACATVTIDPSGNATVGAITTHEVTGNGMGGWTPATWTAMQSCPPGAVVVGMQAHTGVNKDLFVNVSIICSQLQPNATPVNPQTIKIVGSLADANNPVQAQCMAGEVVSQFGTWNGFGLDAVDLFCSPSVCR